MTDVMTTCVEVSFRVILCDLLTEDDSEDDFHTGCPSVSHNQQQSSETQNTTHTVSKHDTRLLMVVGGRSLMQFPFRKQ